MIKRCFASGMLSVLMIVGLSIGANGCGPDKSDRTAKPDPGFAEAAAAVESPATRIEDAEHIENLLKLSDSIYSGGQPVGEEAFAELAARGVKVMVSVDGARPNLELAEKYGMRYIHIPIGYDGIDENAQLQLVKTMQVCDEPMFIHCHHGKHRGPSAAAVCMQGAPVGAWTNEQATAFLEQAGTSHDYAGLYRDVGAFSKPDDRALATVSDQLPEHVAVSDLVEAMANIDRHWDYLKALHRNDFRGLSDHPDVVPAQEALIIAEGLRELVRQDDTKQMGDEYVEMMKASEAAAWAAHEALKHYDSADETTFDAAKSAYNILVDSCKACHKKHRN